MKEVAGQLKSTDKQKGKREKQKTVSSSIPGSLWKEKLKTNNEVIQTTLVTH
jgi:hypothetical protein